MDNNPFLDKHGLLEEDIEEIFTAVETTNTKLVENNIEHLDIILDALTFAIGANIRLMSGDEPSVMREQYAVFTERLDEFMERVIETADDQWEQRTLQ